MPEGPSVLACAHRLHTWLEGALIRDVAVVGGRYAKHGAPAGLEKIERAIGDNTAIVHGVGCKGKLLWWKVSSDVYMLCTLGLSGKWTRRANKHSAIRVSTSRGCVWFTDQLHYGTVAFVDKATFKAKLKKIGPDVLSSPPPPFAKILSIFNSRSGWTLPRVLMDQSKVSGIGNYLKAEILYASSVSPKREIASLTDEELYRVYLCMVLIPRSDLRKRGLVVEDVAIPWRFKMRVYGKKYDPCGREVERLKTEDKRVTHWVPSCQV